MCDSLTVLLAIYSREHEIQVAWSEDQDQGKIKELYLFMVCVSDFGYTIPLGLLFHNKSVRILNLNDFWRFPNR